jgi:hypothetical protein
MKLKIIILPMAAAAMAAATAHAKPLKVYVLAGQSNMQGHAAVQMLVGMAADPQTKPLYDKIADAEGKPREFEDVRMAALSGSLTEPVTKSGPLTVGYGGNLGGQAGATGKNALKFGPELGFGVTMREHLREPFLVIKTSWGGKSLRKDFLSPSGVPVVGGDAKTGAHYEAMRDHVRAVLANPAKYVPGYDPKQGVEMAGFVWFQGWNDMMGEKDPFYAATADKPAFAAYSELLAHFIRDVRKDFNAPKMPFVIGVIGTGGNPKSDHPFRKAMAAPAALPEFKGNVTAVHTAEYFDEKLGELVDRRWRWQRPSWDPENKYAELRAKLEPLKKQMEEGKKLPTQGERAKVHWDTQKKMTDIMYTQEEQEYLKINSCNQGYHYFGSGKMLGRFGEAFAKAMIELKK